MIRVHIAGQKRPTTWFGRFIQLILVAAFLTLGVMFSIIIIPTVVFLGLLIWGYFWWKTRRLREQLKATAGQYQSKSPEAPQDDAQQNGFVIEGEATRVDSGKPL